MNKPFREELDAFETKSFIYNYEVDSFGKVEKIIEQEYHKSRDALVERVEGLEVKNDELYGDISRILRLAHSRNCATNKPYEIGCNCEFGKRLRADKGDE